MLWVVKLPVFCSIYMLCMKPGCVSSSLFGILQLLEGDIGDELFRGTAFQERKRISGFLLMDWGSFRVWIYRF